MEAAELIEIIGRDEDGKHQFKADVTNETSLGQEMVAFSNSGGGAIFVGASINGNSNIRNPILASFATKILPYRGLGSGITRALRAYPYIQFEDNRDGNYFKVTINRKVHE